jgi:hypothetical protein
MLLDGRGSIRGSCTRKVSLYQCIHRNFGTLSSFELEVGGSVEQIVSFSWR